MKLSKKEQKEKLNKQYKTIKKIIYTFFFFNFAISLVFITYESLTTVIPVDIGKIEKELESGRCFQNDKEEICFQNNYMIIASEKGNQLKYHYYIYKEASYFPDIPCDYEKGEFLISPDQERHCLEKGEEADFEMCRTKYRFLSQKGTIEGFKRISNKELKKINLEYYDQYGEAYFQELKIENGFYKTQDGKEEFLVKDNFITFCTDGINAGPLRANILFNENDKELEYELQYDYTGYNNYISHNYHIIYQKDTKTLKTTDGREIQKVETPTLFNKDHFKEDGSIKPFEKNPDGEYEITEKTRNDESTILIKENHLTVFYSSEKETLTKEYQMKPFIRNNIRQIYQIEDDNRTHYLIYNTQTDSIYYDEFTYDEYEKK